MPGLMPNRSRTRFGIVNCPFAVSVVAMMRPVYLWDAGSTMDERILSKVHDAHRERARPLPGCRGSARVMAAMRRNSGRWPIAS